jgi:hypothetical protein
MQDRTIESVLHELREENHVPMARFAQELARQEWATSLSFDLSMLRLWVARKGVSHVEVMVTYGDGRGGGRPSEPYVDAFEVTFYVNSRPADVSRQDSAGAIERLRRWLDVKERGSDG